MTDFRDPSLPIEERIDDLLSRMSLPEKVGQMLMLDAREDLTDAIVARHAGSILHTSPELLPVAHRMAAEQRLAIPLLVADDGIHGHSFWPGATIFGTQLAMACSWDASLVEKAAQVTASEMAATGMHWTFSPVLCISRDLRWGRVDETFGEDPYLLSVLGEAMVRGYQGDGLTDPEAVLACAKHFAGYSETQGGRDASEADLTPRKLRSWFLPPFEAAVRGGVGTVMIGYQSMDGVPITANRWLLNDVLKDEWGFDGLLVTDWDNVGRMVWEQQICTDIAEAAAVAIRAGNDVVMTTPSFFEGAQEAVARGLVTEADIDEAVRRVLRTKFRLGLFENPRHPDLARQGTIGSADRAELNLQLARRSLVLLRNDGTLPFEPAALGHAPRIAVIGPNADDPQAMLGDWAGDSGQVPWLPEGQPREMIDTVLDGFRALTGPDGQVSHAVGAEIGELHPDPAGDTFADGQPRPPIFVAAAPDPALIAEAVAAAQASDLAVVVLGDTVALNGETCSTATLDLQGGQAALLDAVVASGTPTVVVLVQGKPSTLPASALEASAIIEAFNPGMRGGRAIAELVLGLIEPSGRLPLSFARHVGQQPIYYNQIRGQHGDRYADLTQDPLFAFGEGLSYTELSYADLELEADELRADQVLRLSVTVSNTGSRPALETVQAYVSDRVTSATWADQELKGFTQVEVAPGAGVRVTLEIPAAACTIVNAAGRRVVEPGEFELRVGHSSRRADQLVRRFQILASE